MREPLLLPLAALIAGICLSRSIPFSLREACIATALFASVGLLSYWRGSRLLTRICTSLAILATGAGVDLVHKPGPAPTIDAASEEVIVLSGCVVDPPVFTADREHFTVELAPGARARVSAALRPDDKPLQLDYGQQVEFDGRVRPPRNFGNPGAFDYVRYLNRQSIYWTASVRTGAPINIFKGLCGSRALGVIFGLRQRALAQIDRLYAGDSYAAGMMDAILIGESTRLEKVWTDHFRRTGTYHALVISGLHVTVLAGVLLFLLRVCLVKEIPALAIAALGAWLYAGVSGWSAPVVRAAAGFTIYLCGRYFFRRGRVLNMLAAIGIGYLIYDPGQLFDASFQLSFFSVAAIGSFAVPILAATSGKYRDAPREINDVGRDPRMNRQSSALRVEMRLLAETMEVWLPIPKRWSLNAFAVTVRCALWVFEMVIVSAVIQISLALPMTLYFHRISVSGLTANLLIVPLLSAVVPIGFAAVFTGWHPFAWTALMLLRASEAVADWHANLEPSIRVPDPPIWLGVALVAALIFTAIGLRSKSGWGWTGVFVSLGLFGVMFASPFTADLAPKTLELTAIDVGQGDSLLAVLPNGRTMLIDTGGVLAFGRRTKPRMDIGEDVVSPYLWTRHIRRLDVVAITHAHEDHIGGLMAILDNFRPTELWTGATPETETWEALENHARAVGTRVVHLHAGDRRDYIEVLAPIDGYEAGAAAKNNDSLAMRVVYGEHSFLLMGDLERAIEYQLIASGAIQRATVLKVAHHGSRTSSTEEFIANAQPEFAMISAGFENSFHHPHPDVLRRLEDHHAFVLRTDLEGMLTIRSDGHHLQVSRPAHDASPWMSDWVGGER